MRTLRQSQSSTKARPGLRGRGADTNCSTRGSATPPELLESSGRMRLLPAYFSCKPGLCQRCTKSRCIWRQNFSLLEMRVPATDHTQR